MDPKYASYLIHSNWLKIQKIFLLLSNIDADFKSTPNEWSICFFKSIFADLKQFEFYENLSLIENMISKMEN